MLQMYGQVLQENRRQVALSSTSSKLPQVGQNRSIVKAIHLSVKYFLAKLMMMKLIIYDDPRAV